MQRHPHTTLANRNCRRTLSEIAQSPLPLEARVAADKMLTLLDCGVQLWA